MNYSGYYKSDMANGEGWRVTLFVSGCSNHCKGCQNLEAQDYNYGKLYTDETQEKILKDLNRKNIQGLSLSGGDPLWQDENGLNKLIKSTYSLLGLQTFFTAGTDEVRAWTFKKGMKAPECAGIIHNKKKKGFIKAEIFNYYDLEKYGDEKLVKEAGKVRLEGKEYLMQDGDICYFRFNK